MKEIVILALNLGVVMLLFHELCNRAKEKNDAKKLVEAGLRQEKRRRNRLDG